MTADDRTLAYYTAEAVSYASRAPDHIASAPLDEFVAGVPAGGDVLDFGCGSAWAAAHFRDAGLTVTAMDGSPGLAAEALARHRIVVNLAQFDSLDVDMAFDGIWASFCLLHDSRAAMPSHLVRLRRALRTGGLLFLGLKEGTGERRDRFDRFYTYFGRDEIAGLLADAGFVSVRIAPYSAPGLDGSDEPCLDIFARRG